MFFILFSNVIFAQEYSDSQIEKFIQIYFDQKEFKQIDEANIILLFEKNDLDAAKYQSLKNTNEEARSTKDIDNLKQELINLELEYKINADQHLITLCKKYNLEKEIFTAIKTKYQKDLNFHRSLKPYFDAHIQKLNHE
jgi:hypothetical protein